MAALSMTHVLRVVTEVREGVEHRGEEDTGCLLPARYARRQLLVLDEVVVHQFVNHVEIGLTDPAPHTNGGAAAVGVPRLGLVPERAAGTLLYARPNRSIMRRGMAGTYLQHSTAHTCATCGGAAVAEIEGTFLCAEHAFETLSATVDLSAGERINAEA